MKHTIESIRKDINEYVKSKGITLKDVYFGVGLPPNPDGSPGRPIALIFERANNSQHVMDWQLESMDDAMAAMEAFDDLKPGEDFFYPKGGSGNVNG